MMWKASSSNTSFTWLNFRTINLSRITEIWDTNILAHFRLTKAHPSIDFFIFARLDRHAFISRHFLFTVQWHHLLKKPTTKRTMARYLGTGKCGKLFLPWIPTIKFTHWVENCICGQWYSKSIVFTGAINTDNGEVKTRNRTTQKMRNTLLSNKIVVNNVM